MKGKISLTVDVTVYQKLKQKYPGQISSMFDRWAKGILNIQEDETILQTQKEQLENSMTKSQQELETLKIKIEEMKKQQTQKEDEEKKKEMEDKRKARYQAVKEMNMKSGLL